MTELRDQMRRDAEALRSTRRGGKLGMDRVDAFERLFRQLPQLVDDFERAEAAIDRLRGYLDALIANGFGATGATLRALRIVLAGPPAEEELDRPLDSRHEALLWELLALSEDVGSGSDRDPATLRPGEPPAKVVDTPGGDLL